LALSGELPANPKKLIFQAIIQGLAAVAQLDRVLGYEPRGRGFDSCQPHQNKKACGHKPQAFFFLAGFFLF
jgi:hypothetical protein